MKIKSVIEKAIEKITNRNCEECKYNDFIFCKRKDAKGEKCRNCIFPYGYEKGE